MSPLHLINLVLTGENMPVSQVRFDDFEFGEFTGVERMRIPVAFEIQAGPLVILGTPDRYQLTVQDPEPSDGLIELVRDNAERIVDLVGRRSVGAVGHNLQASLSSDSVDTDAVRPRLIVEDFYTTTLGLELSSGFEVGTRFRAGDADQATLKVSGPDPLKRFLIDINYHFDLAKNAKTPSPRNAIDRFSDSVVHGRGLIAQVSQQLHPEGAAL